MQASYASAMHAVQALGDELARARASGASVAARRRLHERVDAELCRAIDAANATYQRLFVAAGGRHHADTDPAVQLWKRRRNTALTIRSQHQLAASDDAGLLRPASVRPATRAAFGPHQAGLDFDIGPDS